jgi:hypothetical protein
MLAVCFRQLVGGGFGKPFANLQSRTASVPPQISSLGISCMLIRRSESLPVSHPIFFSEHDFP